MKKVIILSIVTLVTSVSFAQKVNQNSLKYCLGKVVTILDKCENYEDKKPMIIDENIKYNDEKFIQLWKPLNKKTNRLESIQLNKEYEIEGYEGLGSDEPILWRIKFTSPTRVNISYRFKMGQVHLEEFEVLFDLNTKQYRSVFSETHSGLNEGGRREYDTINIIIENNKVVKKYSS